MTIGIDLDTDARERMADLAAEYRKLIARMEAGEMVFNAPWGDRRFQELANRALTNMGTYKEAAHDLAAIKKVFGK